MMGTSEGTIDNMKIYSDLIQFIDYVINAISNGKYLYYQINYIPENKAVNEDYLNKLDEKMSNKYNANLTKINVLICVEKMLQDIYMYVIKI